MKKALLLIIAIALVVSGCSKQEPANKGNGAKLTPAANSFPIDVPVFPYHQNLVIKAGSKDARATFLTTSDQEAVKNFYLEKLKSLGWESYGKNVQKDKSGLIFKKKNRMLHLFTKIDIETDYTQVTIIING